MTTNKWHTKQVTPKSTDNSTTCSHYNVFGTLFWLIWRPYTFRYSYWTITKNIIWRSQNWKKLVFQKYGWGESDPPGGGSWFMAHPLPTQGEIVEKIKMKLKICETTSKVLRNIFWVPQDHFQPVKWIFLKFSRKTSLFFIQFYLFQPNFDFLWIKSAIHTKKNIRKISK